MQSTVILAAALALSTPTAFATTPCPDLLTSSLPRFADLSPKDFDFTPGKGWRELSSAGCQREAAQAITQYLTLSDRPCHVYFHGA